MRHLHRPLALATLAIFFSLSLASVGARFAHGGDKKKVDDVPPPGLAGRLFVSDKSFPSSASSKSAFAATVKKQAKDRFDEDKEKKQWKIYYIVFFAKPLNDLEFTVSLYDITDGTKRPVQSFPIFLDARGERSSVGNLVLTQGDGSNNFSPNSKVLLEVTSGQTNLGTSTFYLIGEGPHRSGKVTFSEDEANGKDGDQDDDDKARDAAKKKEQDKKDAPKKK